MPCFGPIKPMKWHVMPLPPNNDDGCWRWRPVRHFRFSSHTIQSSGQVRQLFIK